MIASGSEGWGFESLPVCQIKAFGFVENLDAFIGFIILFCLYCFGNGTRNQAAFNQIVLFCIETNCFLGVNLGVIFQFGRKFGRKFYNAVL